MERFVGPAFVQRADKLEAKRQKSEQKKRKASQLNQELLEEVRAVSEGKSLNEFRREKEQKQRVKSKITEKQAAKEEIKERKH